MWLGWDGTRDGTDIYLLYQVPSRVRAEYFASIVESMDSGLDYDVKDLPGAYWIWAEMRVFSPCGLSEMHEVEVLV